MFTEEYIDYRYRYLNGMRLNLTSPVDVSLELSSVCNMSCGYCYHADQSKLPFTKGLMDKNMAKLIISEAADLGVSSLKFNYRGEATLHPGYSEITKFAKSLAGGSVFIDRLANSNFKIPKNKMDGVIPGLAALTKVKVSYDSFDKSVFETQRAGGNHNLTSENIDRFYNSPERIKSETRLVIQAVRTRLNLDEDIEANVKKRWPEAAISVRDVVAGRKDDDIDEYEHKKREGGRSPCKQAFVRIIVSHDGKAHPCCPSIKGDLILGDLKKQSLKDVFNSLVARNLRRDLITGEAFEYDPCRTCSSFESYKGYVAPADS